MDHEKDRARESDRAPFSRRYADRDLHGRHVHRDSLEGAPRQGIDGALCHRSQSDDFSLESTCQVRFTLAGYAWCGIAGALGGVLLVYAALIARRLWRSRRLG
ncbi:hypothetical protein [Catenuloplanes japonicus]|uniref:hypothetical protein n=1 Tax=Catenuloplanes japonicus TaxID=33876 RepID=UPI0012FB9725|nr:hypothetical protein [Catenuloplanes japonicus]